MTNKAPKPRGEEQPRPLNFLETREIKRLIGILAQAGGLELELEDNGRRLRIRMPEPQGRTEYVPVPGHYASFAPPPSSPPIDLSRGESSAEEADDMPKGAVPLNSPMVGTFYRAASPDADPFVKVGDKVQVDATLCILEAMKVMNEIKAELDCEILQILVENGEPVEYGQPLMLVKPL